MDENTTTGDAGRDRGSRRTGARRAGQPGILRLIDQLRADLVEVEQAITGTPTIRSALAVMAVSMRATANMACLHGLVVAECYASRVDVRLGDETGSARDTDSDAARFRDPEVLRRFFEDLLAPRPPRDEPRYLEARWMTWTYAGTIS